LRDFRSREAFHVVGFLIDGLCQLTNTPQKRFEEVDELLQFNPNKHPSISLTFWINSFNHPSQSNPHFYTERR
jgi:hypothetical protein